MPEERKKLYFAYGANLDVDQMQERCPHASLVGNAVLPQYRFIIFSRGVASVTPDPSGSVHGLLWQISPQDIEALDRFEGVHRGHYSRSSVEVEGSDETTVPALMYVGCDEQSAPPRDGYLENIVANAKEHGFPAEYIEELQSWLKT